MERIQSAIAKARAERHGQKAAPAAAPRPVAPAEVAQPSARVDAAWAALKPVTDAAKGVMIRSRPPSMAR